MILKTGAEGVDYNSFIRLDVLKGTQGSRTKPKMFTWF
jgi:hypothetical protein